MYQEHVDNLHTLPQLSMGPGTPKTYKRSRYTSGGSNQKYGGWSQEGIDFFNEKFEYAVKNQKKSWAPKVEWEVMDNLWAWYFRMASIKEIRRSRTRKHGYSALDGENLSPPKVVWDVSAVELSDSSGNSDGSHD